MKFEVGKKYYDERLGLFNNKRVTYTCKFQEGAITLLVLDDFELDDVHERAVVCNAYARRYWREHKEPKVHKIRVCFTKDERGTIRSFIDDSPNQRPYVIGDVAGHIGTYVVHIKEVTYTENE